MDINNFDDIINREQIEQLQKSISNSAVSFSRISSALQESKRIEYEKEQRQINALEQTAKNTGETNKRLNTVIDKQTNYIELLEKQLKIQTTETETLKKQLDIISNIFFSEEKAVEYENELVELLKKELNSKKPAAEFFKNVAEGITANGVTSSFPILYSIFKKFLLSKGVILP